MSGVPPLRPALADALGVLACPHCGSSLQAGDEGGRSSSPVRCERGHAFDAARQGYLSLLTGGGAHGLHADDADMVASRERVQAGGVLAPVAAALVDALRAAAPAPGALVDVGGGTGYYAAACLDGLDRHDGLDGHDRRDRNEGHGGHDRDDRDDGHDRHGGEMTAGVRLSAHDSVRLGVVLDLSRYAARRAARAHPRLAAVVADAWGALPLRDGAAGVVLCVFAPRNSAEFARILAPGGVLAVVTPRAGHLSGLADVEGGLRVDPDKSDRLAAQLAGWTRLTTHHVDTRVTVDGPAAADLLLMGPAAWHVDGTALRRRLAEQRPVETRLAVDVTLATPDA